MLHKEIICADATVWLRSAKVGAIVTSPPDAEEIGCEPKDWENWFKDAAILCLKASNGPVVFYVTDRKSDGIIYSKPALIFQAAKEARANPVWHKIALRKEPGQRDLYRPTFSHLIAFNGKPGAATPDVFDRGKTLYPNGTGLVAARVAIDWIRGQSQDIVDPFCGMGTIPAVAEALGFKSIGIDIDPSQCERARACNLKLRHS